MTRFNLTSWLNPLTLSLIAFLTIAFWLGSNPSPRIDYDRLEQYPYPSVTTQSPTLPVSPTPRLPQRLTQANPVWLEARAVYALDLDTGYVLYQKNEHAELLPASTTKIMTALVALKLYGPETMVTVTNGNESVGQKASLVPNEVYRVADLLHALLLDSGNDAAVTLAQHHPDGYSAFIKEMNQTAQALGLTHTHFANASGIESPYHYSSAHDLAVMAKTLLDNPLLREIVKLKEYTITDSITQRRHYLQNTNQLLGVIPGVEGVKAGECLVTLINRDGHRVLTVVLGSTNRFEETKTLIEWIYTEYQWP